jgi:hypothetical protein
VHSYRETTGTGSLRSHLLKHHEEEWVKECQKLKINLRGKEGEEAMARFTGVTVERQAEARTPFTHDNLLDSLVQFIVATDQVYFFSSIFFPYLIFFKAIMIVERPEFRRLCLLLRPELHESDIPHRTTMQQRILDNFGEKLQSMSQHIQVIYNYYIFCLRLTSI